MDARKDFYQHKLHHFVLWTSCILLKVTKDTRSHERNRAGIKGAANKSLNNQIIIYKKEPQPKIQLPLILLGNGLPMMH